MPRRRTRGETLGEEGLHAADLGGKPLLAFERQFPELYRVALAASDRILHIARTPRDACCRNACSSL